MDAEEKRKKKSKKKITKTRGTKSNHDDHDDDDVWTQRCREDEGDETITRLMNVLFFVCVRACVRVPVCVFRRVLCSAPSVDPPPIPFWFSPLVRLVFHGRRPSTFSLDGRDGGKKKNT